MLRHKVSELCDGRKSCVFGDIADHAHPTAQAWLTAAEPPGGATVETRNLAQRQQFDWLFRNREWVFSPDRQCYCHVHGCDCPLRPGSVLGGSDAAPLSITAFGQLGTAQAVNANEGLVGPPAVWIAERAYLAERKLEHGFVCATPSSYDVEGELVEPLRKTHDVIWVSTGPHWMGYPKRRHRLFVFGFTKGMLDWCGSKGPQKIQKDFERYFNKSVQLDGDAFLQSPDAEREDIYLAYAVEQSVLCTRDELQQASDQEFMKMCLTVDKQRNLQLHQDLLLNNCLGLFMKWGRCQCIEH